MTINKQMKEEEEKPYITFISITFFSLTIHSKQTQLLGSTFWYNFIKYVSVLFKY
jgi:hypothetical protein